MKILHISRTMGQGGAEKIVYQLCLENENEKIVASTGGYYAEKLIEKGIKNYIIPDIDNKNPFLMIKTFFMLYRISKKENVEIIHTHHRMAAFYARLISFFNKKIKLIYTAHNVFTNKKTLTKFSLKKTSIIAVGKGVYNNLVDYYHINEDKITIIYNSIVPIVKGQKCKALSDLKGNILIGTIGRMSEQKGIDVFLNAMKKIISKNKNVYAILIGDGECRTEYERLSETLGISDNTIFLGFQSDIFDLIKQLDFVVLSSRWEGFPLTPIETFSMKKTIIASNIDGNNEIVQNEYNGLLFEKDNVTQLNEKINELINNPQKRKMLEENAYNDFICKYSYDVFSESYKELYRRV